MLGISINSLAPLPQMAQLGWIFSSNRWSWAMTSNSSPFLPILPQDIISRCPPRFPFKVQVFEGNLRWLLVNSQFIFPGSQLDPKFIERHNVTAEVYQAFKEDVDALFSGQMQAQAELIGKILAKGSQLLLAMEAEKQYLVRGIEIKN